ncbi:uncharacterized protein J3R85_015223 [Psidium guajava]|nr:uncharacterized protein J3R85_015223 [Psidium guajava]
MRYYSFNWERGFDPRFVLDVEQHESQWNDLEETSEIEPETLYSLKTNSLNHLGFYIHRQMENKNPTIWMVSIKVEWNLRQKIAWMSKGLPASTSTRVISFM